MTVKVYGSDMCGACETAEQFLEEQGVEFEHKDILKEQESAEDMAEAIESCDEDIKCDITPEKRPAIPIIDTGNKLIIGFDEEELQSI